MTAEDWTLLAALIGLVLMVVAWGCERHLRLQATEAVRSALSRAEDALDRLATERRLHPKRGAHGRFEKRATFGTDRPVG